jgi:hypothetical protein
MRPGAYISLDTWYCGPYWMRLTSHHTLAYNLTDATDIVLQGVSSGAVGVWTNLDYIAGRYLSARVTGLSIAGHNFYATYYEGPHALPSGFLSDFRESALPTTYALYDAFVDQTCKHAYEARGESPGPCPASLFLI